MPNCSVFKCDYADASKDGTYQSFSFPQDSKMREKWLKLLNREDYVLTVNSCFCSKHFAVSIVRTATIVNTATSFTTNNLTTITTATNIGYRLLWLTIYYYQYNCSFSGF